MPTKISFLVCEGVDNCGKSTLIRTIAALGPNFVELKFPKTLPSGALLRINTEKDFELLFTMFEQLDPTKIYLLDRFMVSNIVYDTVYRGENSELSHYYRAEFKKRFNVLEIFLTRPHIDTDFEDDRILLSKDTFNDIIDEYNRLAVGYDLLIRDEAGAPIGVKRDVEAQVWKDITSWLAKTASLV